MHTQYERIKQLLALSDSDKCQSLHNDKEYSNMMMMLLTNSSQFQNDYSLNGNFLGRILCRKWYTNTKGWIFGEKHFEFLANIYLLRSNKNWFLFVITLYLLYSNCINFFSFYSRQWDKPSVHQFLVYISGQWHQSRGHPPPPRWDTRESRCPGQSGWSGTGVYIPRNRIGSKWWRHFCRVRRRGLSI